ncbi:hypothetical protein EHM94_05800 [Marinobacter sp. NP-6]|uniref:hypothetical protein n=1 Tax=Marinobacter sp. NP-6 TaxID=2488666 RepID=UPI000FCC5CEA|nr:hypothetical protein [Marinobacter sp. NP-6]RUT74706.1 hypothetical protein EHM94_05800 [Marinobacter sp. NP-6]
MKKPSKKSYRHTPYTKSLRLEYGPHVRYLPAALVAELTGVSVKTVYKWIAGTHPMDPRTRQVLYTRALGLLPCPRWSDWHIDETGRLTAPNGWSFYPDELMGLSYIKQHNGDLQATVARLTVENRQLREALDYVQGQRWPSNVVPLPLAHRQAQKKPG